MIRKRSECAHIPLPLEYWMQAGMVEIDAKLGCQLIEMGKFTIWSIVGHQNQHTTLFNPFFDGFDIIRKDIIWRFGLSGGVRIDDDVDIQIRQVF